MRLAKQLAILGVSRSALALELVINKSIADVFDGDIGS
jgi:hypothetical protein